MGDYQVRLVDMPGGIRSFVRQNPDGSSTIVLNSRLNHESQIKCFEHEINHLQSGDFEKVCSVDEIEAKAHKGDD